MNVKVSKVPLPCPPYMSYTRVLLWGLGLEKPNLVWIFTPVQGSACHGAYHLVNSAGHPVLVVTLCMELYRRPKTADRGFSGLSAMQILLEGEKETGSANLPGLLDQKKALLSADLAVSCDGGQISQSQGGIPISLRGRISFDLTAQTLSQDVHSGEGPACALESTWM